MTEKSLKIWSIYKIENLINNKIYIGQAKDVSKRWHDHRAAVENNKPTQIIHYAMIKYGLENFKFEVIACCNSLDNANELETILVSQYDSFVGNNKGYNATLGGMNAPKTDEWRTKMSIIMKGRIIDEAWKIKLRKPHVMTPDGLFRLIAAHKGKPSPKRGIPLTEEQSIKVSNSLKAAHAAGEITVWNKGLTGFTDSEETKQKKKTAANKPQNIKANSERRKKFWKQNPNFAPNKGMLVGENHPSVKLTEKQVLEIRNKYNSGSYSYKDLAIEYNVKNSTVTDLIKRRTWKHV